MLLLLFDMEEEINIVSVYVFIMTHLLDKDFGKKIKFLQK